MTVAVATPTTVIREAATDDVDRLVAMGRRFRDDTVYASRVRENVEQMAALTHRLIADENGLLLVVERAGTVVGMIGALLFPHHMSGDLTAGELFFWMEPEHRGYGVRLLVRAERWARERGATTMQMIAPSEEVGILYRRLGYSPLEVAYEKRLGPLGEPVCL